MNKQEIQEFEKMMKEDTEQSNIIAHTDGLARRTEYQILNYGKITFTYTNPKAGEGEVILYEYQYQCPLCERWFGGGVTYHHGCSFDNQEQLEIGYKRYMNMKHSKTE